MQFRNDRTFFRAVTVDKAGELIVLIADALELGLVREKVDVD
jgi:hypothetical protein